MVQSWGLILSTSNWNYDVTGQNQWMIAVWWATSRALSVKFFLQVHFIGKTKLHGGAQLFHPQIEFHSNFCLACALCVPCYMFTSYKPSSPIIDTIEQHSKNIKRCLSSKIIYIERDTLVGLCFSTVFKKNSHKKIFSTSTGKQYWFQTAT